MGTGHPYIPPTPVDPLNEQELRAIAEQNHRNALGLNEDLDYVAGRTAGGVRRVASWAKRQLRRVARR